MYGATWCVDLDTAKKTKTYTVGYNMLRQGIGGVLEGTVNKVNW